MLARLREERAAPFDEEEEAPPLVPEEGAPDSESDGEPSAPPPPPPAAVAAVAAPTAAAAQHRSRRQAAAAAAAAAEPVPVNSKKRAAAAGGSKTNGNNNKGAKLRRPPPLAPGALLQPEARADDDELYSEQEKALSEFLRLHPMLSLESTSHQTLQLVGDLVDQASIPTRDLEVVPKSFDDASLRPPDVALGERPCCMGDKCICVWLARWRHGDDTELAYVGAEFLLPSQRAAFEAKSALPATPGKCLVCTRYYTTYLYRLARADPAFCADTKVPLTAFGNAMDAAAGASVPTHASVVRDCDGYRREALLFVDEAWADSPAARGPMGTFLFRPCVKFQSNHYKYVTDASTGRPRMLQLGVGADADGAEAPHFGSPASSSTTAAQPALANPKTAMRSR